MKKCDQKKLMTKLCKDAINDKKLTKAEFVIVAEHTIDKVAQITGNSREMVIEHLTGLLKLK